MPWSAGSCRFSQPEICSGDHFSATRHRSLAWPARRQSFRAQRPLPGAPIGLARPIGAAAAIAPNLPTDSRGRSSKALCDPPPRPTGGNTPRDLLAFLKAQRSRSSPARLRSNATIESQDTIDTALVPPLRRPSDIRHTLTVLPALPKLSPLLRREPYPCSPLHRTPPSLVRLEGVASIG